ncbi:methyltransferase domain-containing protein [Streptomyces xantholiticus]|uniref:Methyltransferase domain-containing protein n=1 Tax=Streptomyces xantholiticus TaxID=68285 RepID=A0ABV1V556_9ACTN
MTSTLVQHRRHKASASSAEAGTRARDWAEIQERMLVPLYEAVYERLEVGTGTRLLGLGCGSGLALLMARTRGATVTGVDTDHHRLALARERMEGSPTARLLDGAAAAAAGTGYNLITAFQPIGSGTGDAERLERALRESVGLAERRSVVVLTGWGPPERCATSGVLRVAGERRRSAHRDALEDIAGRAGLNPDGSGRVACPFGYADTDSAVRGLLSTGLYDTAVRETDLAQVEKEIAEALHDHRRPDGTVWMPNVFRYLIARTP